MLAAIFVLISAQLEGFKMYFACVGGYIHQKKNNE